MNGTINFIGSVVTIGNVVAILEATDALAVGATPLEKTIAALKRNSSKGMGIVFCLMAMKKCTCNSEREEVRLL